jgi:hypothetical protein
MFEHRRFKRSANNTRPGRSFRPDANARVLRKPAAVNAVQLDAVRERSGNDTRSVAQGSRGGVWNFGALPIFSKESPRGGHAATTRVLQPKLEIGAVDDPLEREADAAADRVMRAPDAAPALSASAPRLSRKCAACEEEDKQMQRKPATAARSVGAAPPIVHQVLRSPGRPLDAATRAFFEPRFGHDFGGVRLHDDAAAAESARSVGALAYTVGPDIVFGQGVLAAGTDAGRRLLAHELTHTVQQGGASAQLQRKLKVDKPTDKIDNPGGTGLVQTNAAAINSYLTTLCADGAPSVDATTGEVKIASSFCTGAPLPPGVAGPPSPSAATSSTATGCTCICDLVASSNMWRIQVDDKRWPHTDFDDDAKALGTGAGGSGGVVTAPSPNSPKFWGAATASGKALNVDPWLVLGHELCGHAWLGNSGSHGSDSAKARGEGGHQDTVARENALRAEHGIELRGTYKDPQCGESFWRDKKAPGTVNWSTYRAICINWRDDYNKTHKTSYGINDKIP